MLTITLNNEQQINVPQSWNEIKLCDYERWFSYTPQNQTQYITYIANICNTDPAFILNSPVQVFDIIKENLNFIFEDSINTPANSIILEGKEYFISFSDDLTLAEWVDIESVLESDNSKQLSTTLSILCRPIGEIYNSKTSESRQPLFEQLTMDQALPLLAFFLLRKEQSERISHLYSQIEQQVDLYREFIHSFVENGDGIKSLPIWQKIKYYFLTRSWQRRLSRCLDSCCTKSKKTKLKKNRINL
ncbi:hypothetical protein D0T53_09110 [Dysgonomonas sp. 216]|uniref:hypothetical protein n=1 Tax=Dysgonomonas sp. 216 TaxID=2302934 RepID=UPI0013D634F2|nr:hypothetical protein [Dysgonomonas sp. 216]NDW19070.1 hypothetical protein [Dysgonomonas sp. 216]